MLSGSTKELIKVPAIITAIVTVARLVGELAGGPQILFGTAAGGGVSLIGIVWLVPIFGIYFAVKLAGRLSSSGGKVILYSIAAFAVLVVGGLLVSIAGITNQIAQLLLFAILAVAAIWVFHRGCPDFGKVLICYGVAARIPVVIVMFFAFVLSLGTHYDAPPPDFPEMSLIPKFILLGLIPQLTGWIAFTVIFGGLFGGIALLLVKGRQPAQA